MKHIGIKILTALLIIGGACQKNQSDIRVGYMPNITHAPVIVGLSQGFFKNAVGPGIRIETKILNAGPTTVEGLFANSLDMAYLGPAPALNAYFRSRGEFVVIAGAATGGAAVVVSNQGEIKEFSDLQNTQILTPELGNTQDVTARAFFREKGWGDKLPNGELRFIPVSNPDQLNLFKKGEIAAAWTVEPWVSRLVEEGGGRVLFDESEVWHAWTGGLYSTTLLMVNRKFLENKPELVRSWLEGHVQSIKWIQNHPEEAAQICNNEIKKVIGKPLPESVLFSAWDRVSFNWDPAEAAIVQNFQNAKKIGFLQKDTGDLSHFFRLEILNDIIKN